MGDVHNEAAHVLPYSPNVFKVRNSCAVLCALGRTRNPTTCLYPPLQRAGATVKLCAVIGSVSHDNFLAIYSMDRRDDLQL